MIRRIDRIVGGIRAAELINQYRKRLREQDALPDAAALAIACESYASGYIYVVAAPGQVWNRLEDADENADPDDPRQIEVMDIDFVAGLGHCALYENVCGTVDRIALDQLDERFILAFWPDPDEQ